ncbi:PepSY domain-containing protein [Xanthomonas sp. SI]|uniref:PepSY domain-containing protein n=1 Tax=Xanthomonas sp. SI TaxID=2724123 RepID=UPI001860ECA8|nr:PepSY domain-containing protein [Xanthomonas sp. SI]QNH10778.1 Peptidase propeptide and YPEB domain protein [Xanthomonas sp. SI]
MNDTNKILSRPLLAMSLSFALAVGSAHAQAPAPAGPALTQAQVKALLSEQGYTKLDKLKFEDGLWKTEATSGDGKRGDVRVGARGGRIYAEGVPSKLSEAEVRAALTTAGYTQVHDVKYDDGLWQAQAHSTTGQRVEVYADPEDGRVVSAERD